VLPADGTASMLASGVEKAGDTEGMPAGESSWPSEHSHADWTYNLLNLAFHLLYYSFRVIYTPKKIFAFD